jgi:hypothetical protein
MEKGFFEILVRAGPYFEAKSWKNLASFVFRE